MCNLFIMSAKKIRRFEKQQPSDNVEVKTNPIDVLDYDSLSKIFMQLPISERMVMERVCYKWKEACALAWYDIKKFKCTKKIDHFNKNRLLTQSFVERVLRKCGIYLNELSLSEVCRSSIMPHVVEHCKNLTSLEFVYHEERKFNDNDYLAFKRLEKLKSMKINVYRNECYGFNDEILNFQSEAIDYLPATMNIIYLIYTGKIHHRPVFFNLKKFKNLHSLTLRNCNLDDIIEDISEKITLVYLNFQDSDVLNKKNIRFDKLVNLKHISIRNSLVIFDSHQNFLKSILNTCKKLRHIEMLNANRYLPVVSIRNWKNLENLVHMSIHLKITDHLAINILKHCYNLKYLEIRCGNVNESFAESALQQLTELKNLECLILPDGLKLSGETITIISNNCKKLKLLAMTSCTINPVLALDELSKLQHLEYLSLFNAKDILDSSIIVIAQKCKNLKYLDISDCNCISERALFTLTTLEKLEKLNVGGIDGVTDEFIVRLERFKFLDFYNCKNITDNGIVQLIKNCPDLKDLNLRFTGITFSMIVEANRDCGKPINDITSYFDIIKF